MHLHIRTLLLPLLALTSLSVLIGVERYGIRDTLCRDVVDMRRARELADRWMSIVEERKLEENLGPPEGVSIPHATLLGEEYSTITTTLGSVEAKELTLNPDFAALLVRILLEGGVDSSSAVGIMVSGSFPTLTISTLAAIQTIGARAVMTSSLGASSYGANQPRATWIDIEHWLMEKGELKYSSSIVSMGAESDTGGGLFEEGIADLRAAALRNNVVLSHDKDLQTAIDRRIDVFRRNNIDMLVNIGGSHAALGGCVHASTIPYGYHRRLKGCSDPDRGVIVRMNEYGIPVLHLLNIRSLAAEYHLESSARDGMTSGVYYERKPMRTAVVAGMTMIAVLVLAAGKRRYNWHN